MLNSNGKGNSSMGYYSGYSNTNGNYNSSIGYLSGYYNNGGSYNTYLGYGTQYTSLSGATSLSYTTAIGANAIARVNKTMILGDNDIKVGIGFSNNTTGPQDKLEINSNDALPTTTLGGNSGLKFTDLTSGSSKLPNPGGVLSVNSDGKVVYVANAGSDPQMGYVFTMDSSFFTLKTNNYERYRINSDGNFGIGTNNPTEKLTVTGNAKISDNLFVDKKLRVQGSLKIDSLAGDGFAFDSLSNNSYKFLLVDKSGIITTLMPYGSLGSPAPMHTYYPQCAFVPRPWTINGDDLGGDLPTRLGTCNSKPLILMANKHESLIINVDGNVGIGTYTPNSHLSIHANGSDPNTTKMLCVEDINSQTGQGGINFLVDKGGSVFSNGFYVTNTINGEQDNGYSKASLSLNDQGIKFSHWFGQTPTVNFKVTPSGVVYAREVFVQVEDFPDFVFDSTYNLRSLYELELFIKAYKHLPEVPSAKEVASNGAELGNMNSIVLQKVEELTLYIIEMNKQLELLKKQNEELQNKVNSIKN